MNTYTIKSIKSGNEYTKVGLTPTLRRLGEFHVRGLYGSYEVYKNGILQRTYHSIRGQEALSSTGTWK